MKKFDQLPQYAQKIINDRFGQYNIDGQEAFESPSIFPDELKELPVDDMLSILDNKHISHIMPQSTYPELASNINNIILEDGSENMSRGSDIMTTLEKDRALSDLNQDIQDGDVNDDGILEFESMLGAIDEKDVLDEIIDTVIPIGICISGITLFSYIKNKDVSIEENPNFFLFDTGTKIVKVAVVGTMISSGVPIVVSGAVAYWVYKSRNTLNRFYSKLYSGYRSEQTQEILSMSSKLINTSTELIIAIGKEKGKTILAVMEGVAKGFVKGLLGK